MNKNFYFFKNYFFRNLNEAEKIILHEIRLSNIIYYYVILVNIIFPASFKFRKKNF
jgi:hypothetical protein